MAKFTKVYENGEITSTLNFMNKDFIVTMLPYENGESKSKERCFIYQIREALGYDIADEIEEFVDMVDYGDEDEVLEALEELEMYE